jgi:hypothetical protein
MHCKQRALVNKRTKVDTATFECESCGKYVYTGKAEKRFNEMVEKYPDKVVEWGKIDLDHKKSVVDPNKGFGTWDDYINGLWVSAYDMQNICKDCHKEKSKQEMANRKEAGSLKRKK